MTFHKGDIDFDGKHFQFKEGIYKKLKEVFHDKEVEDELKKARTWLTFNPPKKDWTRFVCNWLNRANKKKNAPVNEMPQDMGARTSGDPKSMQSSLQTVLKSLYCEIECSICGEIVNLKTTEQFEEVHKCNP